MTLDSSNHIQRLPPELISRIFINCLPKSRHPKNNEAPLNVSSVCTTWRQIAISTPRIWSSISIIFQENLPISYPSILKNWIYRSHNHGFSFTLTWESQKSGVVFDTNISTVGATIDVLVENCAKWRNISVRAYKGISDFTSRILAVIQEGTKQLRQLSIFTPEFPIVKLFTSPLIHLIHLSISTRSKFTPFKSCIPMENLASLSLQDVDIVYVTELLSRAPRLQQAKLQLKLYADEEYPTEPITLLDLQTLDLDIAGGGFDDAEVVDLRFCRFLAYLRLPALKTLFMDLDYIGDLVMERVHWGGIVDLLSRSGATIQNLEVRANEIASFPQFLDAFQSLKHFSITDNLLEENIQLICRLVHDPQSTTCHQVQLCPNLDSLRIIPHEYSSVEDAMEIISSFIKVLAAEGQTDARPLILVVPSVACDSLSLPSGSSLELVQDDDWVARRQHDMYEEIGAHW